MDVFVVILVAMQISVFCFRKLHLFYDWQIVVFNIDGFIVESIKIGQSAIFNRWMFLL
jgi:hypothetical protein